MNITIVSLLEALLLVTALSTDAFVASFGYGTNKIKIPPLSTAIISIVCTLITVASLVAGYLLRSVIPAGMTAVFCFIILFLIGVIRLFDSSIKAYIRKQREIHRKIKFTIFHLQFILNIYADPEEADQDSSRVLSAKEAAALAVALSLDGLAVGVGAAIANVNGAAVAFFSLLMSALAVIIGSVLGNKVAEKVSWDLSWLSGLILIVLAFLKLR